MRKKAGKWPNEFGNVSVWQLTEVGSDMSFWPSKWMMQYSVYSADSSLGKKSGESNGKDVIAGQCWLVGSRMSIKTVYVGCLRV
jgi:hypothetical protein